MTDTAMVGELRAMDTAHYLHPFTDTQFLIENGGTHLVVRGEGVYLWDEKGRRYLDGFAGLACASLGYGREELAQVAAQQTRELAYMSSFFNATHPKAIELAKALVRHTPEGLNHVFFGNSGSDANDTALRMVRHYWRLRGNPERNVVIAVHYAYHGSTVAGGALSGNPMMHEQGAMVPNIVHIPPAYKFEYGRGMSDEDFGRLAASWLEDEILKQGPDRVAAFFIEPLQGAGGGKIPPRNYLPEVETICRKYGVLLVADEVVSGFGRTGQMWACQTLGPIQPDLLCTAKAITSGYFPLSAVMVGDRVADVLIKDGGEFYHGFTYSGHPIGCAIALENLRIMENEHVIERVRNELVPHFEKRMERLSSSRIVGEVRNAGLFGAFELVADRETLAPIENAEQTCEKLREFAMEEGVIVRPIGSTICIAPPLTITPNEIDELFDGIEKALQKFEQHVKFLVHA